MKLLKKNMESNIKPTGKQKRAFKEIVENGRTLGDAMVKAGYSKNTAKAPTKMTTTKGWEVLMEKNLPDKVLATVHKQLLRSTNINHMVFPTTITNEEISKLLKSVNCKVRKVQRGDQATHVWYWSSNDKARKEALDMAYKLKGRYKDKPLIDNSLHITVTKETKIERTNRLRNIYSNSI